MRQHFFTGGGLHANSALLTLQLDTQRDLRSVSPSV